MLQEAQHMMTGGRSADLAAASCLHAKGFLRKLLKLCGPDVLSLRMHLVQAKGLLWGSGAEPTVVCTDGVCRLVRPGQGDGVSHEKWMRHASQMDQLGPAGTVQSPQQQPPEGSQEQTGERLAIVEHSPAVANTRAQCQPSAVSMGPALHCNLAPCQQLTARCTAACSTRLPGVVTAPAGKSCKA